MNPDPSPHPPLRSRRLSPSVLVLAVIGTLFAAVVLRRAVSPWRAVTVTRAATTTTSPTGRPGSLRVGAFNIAHGRGAGFENFNGEDAATRMRRLQDIAAFLAALDLDVVVLNEVDFASVWSGHVDQAGVIADAAGYPFVVRQKNLDVGLGPFGLAFGNAVLSRHPVVEAKHLPLPARSAVEAVVAGRKQSAVITLDVAGKQVRMVPVHLEHRDEATRLASVQRILAAIDGGPPAIVVGDFNSTPPGWPLAEHASGTTALQAMLDAGLVTATVTDVAQAPRTFPSWDPYQRIDWVLVQPPLGIEGDDVGGGSLSDHLAVWSTVTLSRSGGDGSPPTPQGRRLEDKVAEPAFSSRLP